jgi:hypothetical protein
MTIFALSRTKDPTHFQTESMPQAQLLIPFSHIILPTPAKFSNRAIVKKLTNHGI